jgi:adenylyltransferase/sulfurtransferase
MPEVGLSGQEKLKTSSVLVVGAGGLGSPALLYLAAAGVGRLGIVDCDSVDFTNLQRQVVHGTADVGRSKLDSAEDRIKTINPAVEVVKHEGVLSSENALDVLRGYDVVIDGTDNFPTRFLVNDACVLLGKPNLYGSIFRFDGQATVFWPGKGPCYRCLYPEPPPPGMVPSCAEGGVLGVLPGVIGTIQATEAVKILLGKGETLVGRLLLYDALNMRFREVRFARDPACPVCGDNPSVTSLIDYYEFCGVPGHGFNQATFDDEVTPTALKEKLDRGERLVLVDVREPHEYEINRIEGSRLIPLGDLPARVSELDTADEVVVHCLMGGRSAEAAQFLRTAGFKKVRNLQGGIRNWIAQVDLAQPQY